MPKLLKLLLISAFFNALSWTVLIPIWQYPDEQAHFAQVQNVAELGKVPMVGNDTSYEIALSEKILGTERNGFGNNKYTYHPEYNIAYSNNSMGLFEKELSNLPRESRTYLVKNEATLNPPFYYLLGSIAYKLAYEGSFFDRVYAVRLMSVLIFMGTVFLSFKIGQIIFEKEKLLSISLSSLVAFKPMFIFASTGVLPDTLTNFLFSFTLFLSLIILKNGIKLFTLILISLAVVIGVLTRQQFLISTIIVSVALLYQIYRNPRYIKHFVLSIMAFALFIYISNTFLINLPFFTNFRVPEIFDAGFLKFGTISLATFTTHLLWTLRHTYSEVLPWYWGVYKWLSLTLPPVYYQIINRLVLVGILGLVIKLILIFRKRETDKRTFCFFFLLAVSLIYFLVLTIWDYFFFLKHGYSFGIQGRYFFPLVIAHMALLLIGYWQIFQILLKKYAKFGLVLLVFLMILFDDLSLLHIAGSYYNTSNIGIFISQVSQYKPEILKGNIIVLLISANIVSQLLLAYSFAKHAFKKTFSN